MFILFLISLMFPATQGEDFLTRNDLFFDCGEEDYLAYVKDIQYTESGIYAVENIGLVHKSGHWKLYHLSTSWGMTSSVWL